MAIVYQHIRLDNNEVFYIGIGKTKKRAYNKNNNRSKFWKNIVNKTDYIIEILYENLTWKEACNIEINLIKHYGRKDLKTGTLVNLTNGGDGVIGNILSEQTKIKMSNARKNIKITDQTKLNISNSKKGKLFSKEHKENLSHALLKLYNSGYKSGLCKKVIDLKTEKIYDSLKDACTDLNLKYSATRAKLIGQNKNNTNLKYLK